MQANLRTRHNKLKKKLETQKKSKKGGVKGIKKADMQVVLIGFTNSGKSALLKKLTNAHPKISQTKFTTKEPTLGTLDYQGIQIQIIDLPSLKSENFDMGTTNMADLVIMVVTKKEEIEEIKNSLPKIRGKTFTVFNKIDTLLPNEKRKISAYLSSKKHNYILISTITNEGIEELKEKILFSFDIARIYLKEPGKPPTNKPLTVKGNSTLLEVAKKISKDFASKVKEARIWGPSSKFSNQRVGLAHKVKDKDIVEFHTR
jgi:small GTP-binding protein